MTVFISHSFENQPEFENVADWLDRLNVPYWKPAEVRSGASLRGQLREAVKTCSVCIFVATHRSVTSSWCGAELGAFWGSGAPIIVYLADSSLSEDALPPILQGDVWERKLSRVAGRAAELMSDKRSSKDSISPSDSISSMTVEQLERLIAGAVSLVRAREERDPMQPGSKGSIALDAAGRVLRATDATSHLSNKASEEWRRRILWVDDRPDNNTYERQVFESLGLNFTLALSTEEALGRLDSSRFGAIISDMGRKEGPREGYRLLDAVRARDRVTPFFIYAGSNAAAHKKEAAERGAQGVTNAVNELVDMVTGTISPIEDSQTLG